MNARILIIDDETNIRTMMRLSLEHVGHTVAVAADGAEGLEKFAKGENWDLVLLDQRMPGMPGIDVQKEIYRRNPDARLILITAFGTIDLALEAIQAGASDFLRKPFTAETLRASVVSALERPVLHAGAVPVGLVCREFTRTTINGYSFELEHDHLDEGLGDVSCLFKVHRAKESSNDVRVILPAYVMELVKAEFDAELVPGGYRFWTAMCEEALALHLWQKASLPDGNALTIEDLDDNLKKWINSVLTISTAHENSTSPESHAINPATL